MSFFSLRRLSAAVLMTLALAGSALGRPLPSLERSHDYRFPSPTDPRERVTPLPVPGAKALGDGDRVAYVGFDGKTYELNRFHGRYVDVLLPDSWLGPQALSEELVHHFVDRTDLTYQYLLDMVGKEPVGDGPVSVAILPTVCGGALGCGLIGHKGVEMLDSPDYRELWWQEIAEDYPSEVLSHELTHNFDVFSSYLSYVADGIHGWTNFIGEYYFPFTHEGFQDTTPEELTKQTLDFTSQYFNDPTATWESCVRDDKCEDRDIYPRNAYGGFGFRVALWHGPQTVRGFTAFLAQYEQSHQPPVTAEEKNDLYVEALAAGARVNLSCVADALRWPISDQLRQRMSQLYGTRNPDCEDQDHDGYTPLQGDCDDHKSFIHPGARELLNHLDDDCNGMVDDVLYHPRANTTFESPQILPVPSSVSGASTGYDQAFFKVHLQSPERLQIQLCQEGDIYGQVAIDRFGTFVDAVQTFGAGCSSKMFSLGKGDWSLTVGLASETPVNYTMSVQEEAPWPLPPWARTAPPASRRQQWVLKAPTAIPHLPETPTTVRFWVSGQGYVGTVPYSRNVSFAWTPPPGVDPEGDGLTYRAQVLAGGVPVYEITPPQAFPAP